jgi:hypothetical protein
MITSIQEYKKMMESHAFRDYDNYERHEVKEKAEGWLEEYMTGIFPNAAIEMDSDSDNDGEFVFGVVNLEEAEFNVWLQAHDAFTAALKNDASEFIETAVDFSPDGNTVTYYVYY